MPTTCSHCLTMIDLRSCRSVAYCCAACRVLNGFVVMTVYAMPSSERRYGWKCFMILPERSAPIVAFTIVNEPCPRAGDPRH